MVVGQCYRYGLAGIWWQFMWLFCTPIYWLTYPLLRRMRVTTTADYWAERFSPSLGTLAALVGVVGMTMTVATILTSMNTIMEPIIGQGSKPYVIATCAALFCFYGILGGLYASTITDIIQGLLQIVLSVLLLPFIFARTGGMSGLHQMLDPSRFDYTIPGEFTVFAIVMLSLNAIVGVYTGPHTMTNAGSGRNEMDVRIGVLSGTLLKRFCTAAWAFLGLGALALFPNLDHHEDAFGSLVTTLLPPGLRGLMIAAILASVMSTCSALMLTGSALATRNLYAKLVPRMPERHYLDVGRIASGGVVVVATMMALFHLQNVLDGLKMIWTVYALMGLAWWAGVLWPRATTAAAWVSTLTTVSAYLATLAYNAFPQLRGGGPALLYQQQIAIYLSCGLIALIVTSYLTSHRDPGRVRRFYRKMRTPTTQPSEFDSED